MCDFPRAQRRAGTGHCIIAAKVTTNETKCFTVLFVKCYFVWLMMIAALDSQPHKRGVQALQKVGSTMSATGAARQLRRWAQEAGVRRLKKYKNPPTFSKWKVVRGDKVAITRGPYKGDQGTVLKVHRKKNMVTVDNTRVVRKAVKGTEENPGGITSFPAKFHVSAVALVDPVSGKPTRVSFRYQEDGTKVRVAKKSGSIIPRPDALTERTTARRMGAFGRGSCCACVSACVSVCTPQSVALRGGLGVRASSLCWY